MNVKEFLKNIEKEPRTLKVVEVAKVLKTTPTTIHKGIKNGTLPIGFCVQGEKDVYIIPSERFLSVFKGLDAIESLNRKEEKVDTMLDTLQAQLNILNDQVYFSNKERNVAQISKAEQVLSKGV